MNKEEDGWFDASEDPDCPFIEHSDQKTQENVWIPVSENVLKKLRIICDANDLRIDPAGLSMYEGLQLISRYEENTYSTMIRPSPP